MVQPATQAPETQLSPVAQRVPQLPQLSGSESTDTQLPPQLVWPGPHVVWHRPAEHTLPEPQLFPHPPQLAESV